MFHDQAILRKLSILHRLALGERATPEELATTTGYRTTQVKRSLEQLAQQGIITKLHSQEGHYLINQNYATPVLAAWIFIKTWIEPTANFLDIARDSARAILTRSWSRCQVEDVLLYGSTLSSDHPRDIDLLILHQGDLLSSFERSIYFEERSKPIPDLTAGDPKTTRFNAYDILRRLGYGDHLPKDQTVVRIVSERIAPLHAGKVSQDKIKQWTRYTEEDGFDITACLDINGVANVFDIHAMHTGLLDDRRAARKKAEGYRFLIKDEAEIEECAARNFEEFSSWREEAIASSMDPTFWHRVLSQGKLYDLEKNDFTIPIETKYPEALRLFEINPF
ncbi:MAG TPA: hypothetical protein VFE88_00550 [Candidatus Nanoarchaeia archaeon]|nr:hypothetical protein [Candidatus Nanoarchaeia archaeon]